MNANGQRFFLLADAQHWAEKNGVRYDRDRRLLALANERTLQLPDSQGSAAQRLQRTPGTMDRFGTRARWDDQAKVVRATRENEPEVVIYTPPAGQGVSDLTAGYDRALYIAVQGRVDIQDLSARFELTSVTLAGFSATRLAAHPNGGVYVLGSLGGESRVARLTGLPFPTRPFAPYRPDVFRPKPENPTPPQLRLLADARWPNDETAVGIATSPTGRLALLTWLAAGDARLRLLDEHGRFGAPRALSGSGHPYSISWLSETEVALLIVDATEAVVYPVDPDELPLAEESAAPAVSVLPSGNFYPLRDHDGGPLLNSIVLPPQYPTSAGAAGLYPLSLPGRLGLGSAVAAKPLRADSAQTVWDRIYLEARIPVGCSVCVELAATQDAVAPDPKQERLWSKHHFGAATDVTTRAAGEPLGAWLPQPSELPQQPGLLSGARVPRRSGLFTALIQRTGTRVRTLRGRYLWARLTLRGDGRIGPEIAALRIYAPRFSYVDSYLPALYRESVFAPEAEQTSAVSTPADFLGRFLGNFEGILTPLEDRIAAAYLLTCPRTTPDSALEWLGSWIGYEFDGAFPPGTRRKLLEHAPDLYACRGTLRGLQLALDIVSGGAVQRGAIVVLEDFKLRRTFATILGADLADRHDPLLPGISASGNSYVGDTLFLGEESRREFMALFAAELGTDTAAPGKALDDQAIRALFDGLAYRSTVLVHDQVEPFDLGLIRRVVQREAPAHVLMRVLTASQRFLVGMSSLVGVDTFLGPKDPAKLVQLGRSFLGEGDIVEDVSSLDPRLGGDVEAGGAPSAHLTAQPRVITVDQSLRLDGSRSVAAPGRTLRRLHWKQLS